MNLGCYFWLTVEGLTEGIAGASGNLGSRADVFHVYLSMGLDVNAGLSHLEVPCPQHWLWGHQSFM